MDLESARSKQRIAQQQAQTQPDGVARIGDRDPETGRYSVQHPDGGIGANGIKTYTAASNPGDIVVMFPRPDGSVALDSEKGSPTIVPDVFNKPVPDPKKGEVWIFYRSAGKLWVGGHQKAPESIATLSVVADPSGVSSPYPSCYHVWGDKTGWVATYQVTEFYPQDDQNGRAITFYCVSNNNQVTGVNTTRRLVGQSTVSFPSDGYGLTPSHSTFPLGGGFVAFRSNVIPSVPIIGSGDTRTGMFGQVDYLNLTYSGSFTASVGYLNLGVPSIESFEIAHKNVYISGQPFIPTPGSCSASTRTTNISFDGTTRIPNVGACTYKGAYLRKVDSVATGEGNNTPREFNTQSILTYAIMCDRSATYYIRETISATGVTIVNPIDYSVCFTSIVTSPILGFTSAPLRKYELFSSASAQVIATNSVEPRFFGIRWDLRDSRFKYYPYPADNASLVTAFYNDPRYYSFNITPASNRDRTNTYLGTASMGINPDSLAVGYYRRSRPQPPNSPPLSPIYDYDDGTPVTYSGGSVVLIPATEIFKATIGDGYLVRKVAAASGTVSTITSAFCFAIPSDAEILHWSTTTV